MKNFHSWCKIINVFPRLDMDGGYTDNRYPLCVSLPVQF